MNPRTVAGVAAAGALGALAMHWLGEWLTALVASDFPLATLIINLSGSALLGFVAGWGVERNVGLSIALGLAAVWAGREAGTRCFGGQRS